MEKRRLWNFWKRFFSFTIIPTCEHLGDEGQKGLHLKHIFARLPCQGDILNKFKNVTHKFVTHIQTVLWLFALKQTSHVVVILFLGPSWQIEMTLKKSFSILRSQFWTKTSFVFHVTHKRTYSWQTVQNHLFNHNFLIFKRKSNPR